jgi:hypothetical protein
MELRYNKGWPGLEEQLVKKFVSMILALFCFFVFAGGIALAQEEDNLSTNDPQLQNGHNGSADHQNGDADKEPAPQEVEKKEVPQETEVKQEAPQRESVGKVDDQKQDLLERIEELEKRINELTEESRARRKLEITEQEKQEKEKDVLEAVGREYTLDAKHSLGLDYIFSYNYSPSERISSAYEVTDVSEHKITHTISTSYAVLDNLSVSSNLPFAYRYKNIGANDEIKETDVGDISVGCSFQPWKNVAGGVNKTFSISVGFPTGRSPYDINNETELSTGSGIYSVSAGGSFSKQIDPVVAFWSCSYAYNFDATGLNETVAEGYVLEKVETGNSMSLGAGLAYALSYKVSVNSSINASYSYGNTYFYKGASSALKSEDTVSATMGFGMGWKVSNKTTLSFSLGYGLTGTGFSVSLRVPFTFVL